MQRPGRPVLRDAVRTSTARGWSVREQRGGVRLLSCVPMADAIGCACPSPGRALRWAAILARVRNIYLLTLKGHDLQDAAAIAEGSGPQRQDDWTACAADFRRQKLEHGGAINPTTWDQELRAGTRAGGAVAGGPTRLRTRHRCWMPAYGAGRLGAGPGRSGRSRWRSSCGIASSAKNSPIAGGRRSICGRTSVSRQLRRLPATARVIPSRICRSCTCWIRCPQIHRAVGGLMRCGCWRSWDCGRSSCSTWGCAPIRPAASRCGGAATASAAAGG